MTTTALPPDSVAPSHAGLAAAESSPDEAWRRFLDAHGELAYSDNPYDPLTTSANFSLDGYLTKFDAKLLNTSEGRKHLTKLDPMLFALIYMRKHLRNAEGDISFADAHFLWVRAARRWIGPARGQREDRRAFVAPRSCGKSTWFYLILVMWAGAHRHVKFAAAFADSGAQAEMHLSTFKTEQAENALLRADFPDFCAPARRHTGRTVADNQNMLHTRSGFTFVAKGIDSTSLGMKMGADRPDLLIFDDIEPPEATYSPYQRDRRLSTVQNAILPLNELARVVVVGTVTMPGSIIHELVRHNKGEGEEAWVDEEKFRTYHTRPIVVRPDGSERSVWPKKWSWEYLNSIRNTRSFKLNYDNDPKGREGDYWSHEDIRYGIPPNLTKWFLFVDPPVTQKTTSDPCGLSVVGYAPPTLKAKIRQDEAHLFRGFDAQYLAEALLEHEVQAGQTTRLSRVCILDAWGVQMTGANLKKHVLETLIKWPQIRTVVVENNNGGDLWIEIFEGLPVRLITYGSHESKDVRFTRALDHCQKRRVSFAKAIPALEDQLTSYPKVAHDDIMDAAAAGMLRLLKVSQKKKNTTLTPR